MDAIFESVAGFTTTGSTVLADIEATPHALLLWRSLTQWLGGMGIVLFTVALMPLLGIGGMELFKAEVPGPIKEKVRPRVAETARQLWLIYVGLTAAQCLALMLAGMGGFDALCHSLTTLSTGGFSTRNASVGAFESAAVEWIHAPGGNQLRPALPTARGAVSGSLKGRRAPLLPRHRGRRDAGGGDRVVVERDPSRRHG